MARRSLVSFLWFTSLALTSEVIWSVAGTPRLIGVVIAAAVAALVWLDIFQRFHPLPQVKWAARASTGAALLTDDAAPS